MKKNQNARRSARPGARAVKPDIVPLDGALGRAVHALAAGLHFRTSAWPDVYDAEWPVYESGIRLARDIVGTALGVPGSVGEDDLARAADAHFAQVRELARGFGTEPPSLDGYAPTEDDLGMTTAALREQALDHHTSDMMLGTHESGGWVLLSFPVTPAQAHVWLLGPLYEKLESWAREDPMTAMERAACAWWFSRWRGPRPLPGDEFARGVREQEFTFVDRPMHLPDATPVEHMAEHGGQRGLGGRQKHMAVQLARSEAGVWRVESRAEGRAVFVGPSSGREYVVREHATLADIPYGPGFIALGRLIPFGDGTWLRSPGTFLMGYGTDSHALARQLAEGLETQRGGMPLPAAIELAAHTLYGVRGMPRAVPPAPTPDDAAERGRDLGLLLREAGLARVVDATANPDAVNLSAKLPNTEILEYHLDIVLAEFMGALVQQSQKSRLVRQVKRRRERQAQKKKGKGRR